MVGQVRVASIDSSFLFVVPFRSSSTSHLNPDSLFCPAGLASHSIFSSHLSVPSFWPSFNQFAPLVVLQLHHEDNIDDVMSFVAPKKSISFWRAYQPRTLSVVTSRPYRCLHVEMCFFPS